MSVVIKVENLSKQYRLGLVNSRTIKDDVLKWWCAIIGKENPLLRVGEVNDRTLAGDSNYVWPLKDINFEVKQGEVLGIIGKNGAGKSTLLKILSTITAPTLGVVKSKGRIASLLEVGTGFHPELTGKENIYLNGAILGMKRSEIRDKMDEIISFAGVERYIDTPVKRYSSGMYVRLAFSVAAHLESDILIIDEVLSVGDAEFQKKCLGKMNEMSKADGRTVLYVSHNLSSIKDLCSRAVVLEKGSVIFDGDVDGALARYGFDESVKGIKAEYKAEKDESKQVQILSGRLVNNKKEVCSSFNVTEDVEIQLIVNIVEIVPSMYGFLSLIDNKNNRIIVSDTNDHKPSVMKSMKLGENKFNIVIPKNVLGVADYLLHVSFASVLADNFILESPENILAFSVQDNISSRGNKRNSITSVYPKWKLIV